MYILKKCILFLVFILFFVQSKAQTRMLQHALAFRLNVNPSIEYWKTKEGIFYNLGSSLAVSLNDNLFIGGYFQKSINKLNSSIYKETKLDLIHGGINFGWLLYSPTTEKVDGEDHGIQIALNLMLGTGVLSTQGREISSDNFYEFLPCLDIEYKINQHIRVGLGIYNQLILELNQKYQNTDFENTGIRFIVKLSFFNYKFGMLYRNRILGL